jgi:diadenosine tetraphosphate (Ap4A) HIT family hydrolase
MGHGQIRVPVELHTVALLSMPTLIHTLVESCRAGTNPATIARMSSGWAVMGSKQFLRGYSLLLPDPVVPDLNALERVARSRYLGDLGLLGDAVLKVTGAVRINYAIFGNLEPALHGHVVPRYADELPQLRTQHPWSYDWSLAPDFDPLVHGELREAIARLVRMA